MLTLYKQFDAPHNLTGVPITLSVIDANGNFRTIGTTTSDSTGNFKLACTPDITGDYTVIASFDGSKAYYGSHTQTSINVANAPSATATSGAPGGTSTVEQWFIPGIIAVIIVIIIVGAVLALMIRRR
jgi:subtilase family serine protease